MTNVTLAHMLRVNYNVMHFTINIVSSPDATLEKEKGLVNLECLG